MAYTDNETFNLSPVQEPDLWVTYKRPGMMTYEESMKFFSSHPQYNKKIDGGFNQQTMKEFLEDYDTEFSHVSSLITAWNLKDKSTGEILPTPEVDKNVWKKVTALYIFYIITTIKNDPTASDFLSKGMGLIEENKLKSQSLNEEFGQNNSLVTIKP